VVASYRVASYRVPRPGRAAIFRHLSCSARLRFSFLYDLLALLAVLSKGPGRYQLDALVPIRLILRADQPRTKCNRGELPVPTELGCDHLSIHRD
jgi:hypothetical protein